MMSKISFTNFYCSSGNGRNFTVYALKDRRKSGYASVFYIGITSDMRKRFADHMNCRDRNGRRNAIILGMRKENELPLMEPLESLLDEYYARAREAYWIYHYLDLGAPLTNSFIPPLPDRVGREEDFWLWSEEEQGWKVNDQGVGGKPKGIRERVLAEYGVEDDFDDDW
jgi:hypothetical protein